MSRKRSPAMKVAGVQQLMNSDPSDQMSEAPLAVLERHDAHVVAFIAMKCPAWREVNRNRGELFGEPESLDTLRSLIQRFC
jgi:hypothetical protein